MSLSQKLLGGLLAISLAFTTAGAVAAFVMFRDRAERPALGPQPLREASRAAGA